MPSDHELGRSWRGRGAGGNPANRFETVRIEADPEAAPEDRPRPETWFLDDLSQTVISRNTSPDLGFSASLNPYRGCEHGCIYCYARPTHEYLGFSAGLDFETRIMVKRRTAELLEKELAAPRYQPETLVLSGVTDPYQPVERELRLTRGCLEVLERCGHPVVIITKNRLVARDKDILARLARRGLALVLISLTTLDAELAGVMEPRTARPELRLRTVRELAEAGIPVGTLFSPIIPGLTDEELPALARAAAEAGACFGQYALLRLPHAVADLFTDWLERTLPGKKDRILERIRGVRGGGLNESRFGVRLRGEGFWAEQVRSLFTVACRRAGLATKGPELTTGHFTPPGPRQLSLFET
ncbi:MAG: PA0069 family radical SAM protein [Puniceicoccaceae bacterium]|nr:MAG: PA0069 family radical SAM protein [Puniceicoccaceae bacterium]